MAIVAARVAVDGWSWLDLEIAVLLVTSQPFTEWLIHVFLLHSKPRKLGPFTIDLPTARLHRWRHENPTMLEAVLIPGSLIAAFLLPVMLVMWLLSWPWALLGDGTTVPAVDDETATSDGQDSNSGPDSGDGGSTQQSGTDDLRDPDGAGVFSVQETQP